MPRSRGDVCSPRVPDENPHFMTDSSRDPQDETQPIDPNAFRAAASTPAATSYSPAPDPRSWGATHWATAEPTPERWFETPAAAPARPAAAILASGGTVAALNVTGAFDRAAALTAASSNATSARQPLSVDESSAVIDVAAKAGPSVVRISTQGIDPNTADPPQTEGVGSGILFDQNGWILTNRHVVAG